MLPPAGSPGESGMNPKTPVTPKVSRNCSTTPGQTDEHLQGTPKNAVDMLQLAATLFGVPVAP